MIWANDKWFGEDKLTHAAYTFGGWLALTRVVPWWAALLVELAAGVGVELIQGARLAAGKTTFAEAPSYRDLAWDGIGILAAIVLVALT